MATEVSGRVWRRWIRPRHRTPSGKRTKLKCWRGALTRATTCQARRAKKRVKGKPFPSDPPSVARRARRTRIPLDGGLEGRHVPGVRVVHAVGVRRRATSCFGGERGKKWARRDGARGGAALEPAEPEREHTQHMRSCARGPREDHPERRSHRAQRFHQPEARREAAVHGLPGRRAAARDHDEERRHLALVHAQDRPERGGGRGARAPPDQPHRFPRTRRLLQRGFHRRAAQRRRPRRRGRRRGRVRPDARGFASGLGGAPANLPRVQQARQARHRDGVHPPRGVRAHAQLAARNQRRDERLRVGEVHIPGGHAAPLRRRVGRRGRRRRAHRRRAGRGRRRAHRRRADGGGPLGRRVLRGAGERRVRVRRGGVGVSRRPLRGDVRVQARVQFEGAQEGPVGGLVLPPQVEEDRREEDRGG